MDGEHLTKEKQRVLFGIRARVLAETLGYLGITGFRTLSIVKYSKKKKN
jgi:hypothetical protein